MRRNKIIKVIRSAIIVKIKAILLETAQNFPKTSIDLSNLYTGDW